MHVNNMREICKFIDVGKLRDISHVHIIRTKPATKQVNYENIRTMYEYLVLISCYGA